MIGIAIAVNIEWEAVLTYYNIKEADLNEYPFGLYFCYIINKKECIFYKCTGRKVISSSATQYMIDKFKLEKIILIGTCAGINDKYKTLDILIPNLAVQYDCTVKEIEPLIKERFNVEIDLSKYGFNFNNVTIGTSDKAVVMWKDYLELKKNNITIADCESAAVAYICKANNIECIIIKGISDFPKDETGKDKLKFNEEQINVFITNTPLVMNKICKEYLNKFI
jgi:adenosylhomocysteine nucleosidase/adenosylhomocysteine/aminodeoxyfutalosine nucleosidase